MTDFENSGWGFGNEGAIAQVAEKGPSVAPIPKPVAYKETSRFGYALQDAWRAVRSTLSKVFGSKADVPTFSDLYPASRATSYQRPEPKEPIKPVDLNEWGLPKF